MTMDGTIQGWVKLSFWQQKGLGGRWIQNNEAVGNNTAAIRHDIVYNAVRVLY